MKVSIIIPVYNEEKTVGKILNILSNLSLSLKKEIIIIDDGSKDESKKVIQDYMKKNKSEDTIFKFHSKPNGGKGSAIKKGISLCSGDIITIQDADLEYDPNDLKKLIKPILDKKEKVVYGSRFLKEHQPLYKIYYLGNKFLTLITKLLFNSKITDMETCYKVFHKDIIKNLNIKANHFDMEPEITAKILKSGIRIKEIPISYNPRSIKEGKKINWKDGIQAIWTLLYWKFNPSTKQLIPTKELQKL
jgi:dolichol-phosphate mannosyltransferase